MLGVLERLVVGYKGRGEYQAALTHARRLASEDPWREEAHREVMSLCHVLGRGADALKQYDICRRILAEGLGTEPSPETAGLAAEIAERAGRQEPAWAPVAARPSLAPLLDHPDRLPLVGRQSALAEILKEVEAAAGGTGGLILVYGEAGVGKTHLLRELARNAQWRGIRTAWGRCYELAGSQAYQPLVEVLRLEKARGFGGANEPFRIWLTCYQVLEAGQDPRAGEVLTVAYERLIEQRSNIHDEALEHSFVENVVAHREIIAAYQAWQARQPGGPRSVRLPRAGAPLRRSLGDDDYVTVAWTPDAPQDIEVAGAGDRRRQRLSRLLRQASEQGAAPTVDDVAQALGASVATIKRDRPGRAAATRAPGQDPGQPKLSPKDAFRLAA